jgi:hypothetical protein
VLVDYQQVEKLTTVFCAKEGANYRNLCQKGGAEMLVLYQGVRGFCAGAGDNEVVES